MCIHVHVYLKDIDCGFFSKLTATVDISYIRESVEMKQKPVITYIHVGVFQYA